MANNGKPVCPARWSERSLESVIGSVAGLGAVLVTGCSGSHHVSSPVAASDSRYEFQCRAHDHFKFSRASNIRDCSGNSFGVRMPNESTGWCLDA